MSTVYKGKRINKVSEREHKSLVRWAADCAEHVLRFFEQEYPDDNRPREAIEAARAWANDELTTGEARRAALAAHAAAREAGNDAAIAAARSTGHAAGTAHVTGHARHAADYALDAAAVAGIAGEDEWQYRHLPAHLRRLVLPVRRWSH